tara:strand:+ start:259 stop:468 length:210 start_codon:yes stop_codon:yes gene_type:complete
MSIYGVGGCVWQLIFVVCTTPDSKQDKPYNPYATAFMIMLCVAIINAANATKWWEKLRRCGASSRIEEL